MISQSDFRAKVRQDKGKSTMKKTITELTEYILKFILGIVIFIFISACGNLFVNDDYLLLSIFVKIMVMIGVVVSAGFIVTSVINAYLLLVNKHNGTDNADI